MVYIYIDRVLLIKKIHVGSSGGGGGGGVGCMSSDGQVINIFLFFFI